MKEKIIHVATNKNNELVEYGSDEKIVKTAEIIASEVIDKSEINNDRDRKIDKILTWDLFFGLRLLELIILQNF